MAVAQMTLNLNLRDDAVLENFFSGKLIFYKMSAKKQCNNLNILCRPLSPSECCMFLIEKTAPFNIQNIIGYDGEINNDLSRHVLELLQKKHPLLNVYNTEERNNHG
ncbi:MAG: hypothetical protein AABY34_06495 [Pseudomonadota bacterium]